MFREPHDEPFFTALLALTLVLACSVLLAFIGVALT